MTRYGISLIVFVLVAVSALSATPAVGAPGPKPDRDGSDRIGGRIGVDQVVSAPTADGGSLSLVTGRSRPSRSSVNALSCWTYWGEITRTTYLGAVHWRWRHTVEACYDGVVVLEWRQQYDQLMEHDGSVYLRDAYSRSASELPATPATAFYQRQLEICFWAGCWYSHHPWVRINVNGDGSRWYEWGVG
jgi:hypothetical protein